MKPGEIFYRDRANKQWPEKLHNIRGCPEGTTATLVSQRERKANDVDEDTGSYLEGTPVWDAVYRLD